MTYVERGLYRELLDECWAEGSIPSEIDEMADICGCPTEIMASAWQVLSKCFVASEQGRLINERLDSERTEKDKLRIVRSVSGGMGGVAKSIAINQDLASAKQVPSMCHIEEKRREEKRREENTPLPPSGDGGKKIPKRKIALDCSPESQEAINAVYSAWPKETSEGMAAKKGSKALAEKAFQSIVDSGEATIRELKSCGMLYAKADSYPAGLKARIYDAWDHRDHAVMHVASFYGPTKRPYRQLLALARELIIETDRREQGKTNE